jgi:ATP-dependent helicase HrpA
MPSSFQPALPSAAALALPVYAHEAELLAAIRKYPVVVVEGPTGCGKTTQIPQILLRAGLTDRMIGVTQPRRIAAVSVAWRIAEEQGVPFGAEVGYEIRFDDRTSSATRIKIMTDGILLQEARKDPDFDAYGVLVIDEAHERSLNIDFILGLLHEILQRRPDLRVIISSATLQPDRFVKFYKSSVGEVPVVSIQARPHPVDIAWRPPFGDRPDELAEAIALEVQNIHRAGNPGHVLVFLPGEDAIRRTGQAIAQCRLGHDLVVLPLYGALTREEQERVFAKYPGQRKVILATNIAETSITIDDVRFVIDSGLAKVPRISPAGVLFLREEGISQASAEQRKGRAGRTAPGTCIRLFSPEWFKRRDRFTDEEILRLDLAEVVLRLIDLGIRDVESFPFPTPPQSSRLRSALQHLHALGAIDQDRHLTPVGKRMVPFPLSPTLARMVVEAADRHPDVVDEVLVVAAFLSVRSPLLYPPEQEEPARRAHAKWAHPLGDAVTAVQVFRGWQQADDKAAFCTKHFLDPGALSFIDNAHRQLRDIAKRMDIADGSGGDPLGIARAVAAGFAHQILANRGRWYEGPGEEKISLHPSSSLYAALPRFVVAVELVVSARAYARQVSVVKPGWVVELRPDLAERWHLDAERTRKAEGPAAPPAPRTLQLGNVTLEVDGRKGRPRIDIPFEAVDELSRVDVAELPAGAAAWQARILVGDLVFAQGTPLGALLPTLRFLPLPQPGDPVKCTVPEGALLEVDRNGHTLQRHLPELLKPMRSSAAKRPGWLMLVANGGGGYWFEVGMDYREVLETTALSLDDLLGQIEDDDPVALEAQKQLERIRPQLESVLAALAVARQSRRRG